MSTHDVLSLLFQFSLIQIAGLTLIVTIVKHMFDIYDKKK